MEYTAWAVGHFYTREKGAASYYKSVRMITVCPSNYVIAKRCKLGTDACGTTISTVYSETLPECKDYHQTLGRQRQSVSRADDR